ncbi:MAG: rRNA methyltransferase [Spirochaetaceae bacterium]|nr:rRNA methyltransferase [Spirochaetaceae bacterium]
MFASLDSAVCQALENLLGIIDRVFPLPRRFRAGLPRDIAELSGLLTGNREARSESYLGKPGHLSAYLRYFLPWNVYRLCRLLPGLDLSLRSGDVISDLGCGPLTFPIALWISRPDLRELALEFRCLDHTYPVLEAGKTLFSALIASNAKWHIQLIRGSLETRTKAPKAALISASQVFNEVFWGLPHRKPELLAASAGKYARLLASLLTEKGVILIVEPGIPRSGEGIAALRAALLDQGYTPLMPCPHSKACPFPGGFRAKWCHFAFDTQDAPPALLNLSAAAGIPKERAVLSFLLAHSGEAGSGGLGLPVRIISDAFPVSGRYGRYGCSPQGAVLVTGPAAEMESWKSGALLRYAPPLSSRRDKKSGALLLPL